MKWTLIGQCCARHPIHPPLLKIGSYLDNSLNISLTGFPQTCGGLLCFTYSKFFVNDSIDALFNLFNLFPVSRGVETGANNRWKLMLADASLYQYSPQVQLWTTIVLIHQVFPLFFFFSLLAPWCLSINFCDLLKMWKFHSIELWTF